MKGRAFRVRVAARLRMAVKWGVLLDNVSSGLEGVSLWSEQQPSSALIPMRPLVIWTNLGLTSLDLIPYFASVEYSERAVWVLFGGDGRSTLSKDASASSRLWNASSSLR